MTCSVSALFVTQLFSRSNLLHYCCETIFQELFFSCLVGGCFWINSVLCRNFTARHFFYSFYELNVSTSTIIIRQISSINLQIISVSDVPVLSRLVFFPVTWISTAGLHRRPRHKGCNWLLQFHCAKFILPHNFTVVNTGKQSLLFCYLC